MSFFLISQPELLLTYTGFSKSKIIAVAVTVARKVSEHNVSSSGASLNAVCKKYDTKIHDYVSMEFESPSVDETASME
jgi:hypothetical protein